MLSIRSPEDLYDNSNVPDGEARVPSPNTAALLAPPGNITPACATRTRDGQPRLMDLNNLGLQKGTHPQTPGNSGQEGGTVGQRKYPIYPTGQNGWPHGIPRNARIAALQAESSAPPQAEMWKHQQRQRVEKVVSRIQKTYVSEARASHLPPIPPDPDPMGQYRHQGGTPSATARPSCPVSLDTPHGWEQDKAMRTRRATDRIQQTYVSEARTSNLPPEHQDPDPPGHYRHPGGTPAATVRPSDPVSLNTPQGWEQDKAMRARRATDRIQQTYVSEARTSNLPPEHPDPDHPGHCHHPGGTPAATARPSDPVSLDTPQGWEQDKAMRARRATDRIHQTYVSDARAPHLLPEPPGPDSPVQYHHVAVVAAASVPPQAEVWTHEQRQRVKDATNRIHQTYVNEARVPQLPSQPLDLDSLVQYRHPGRATAPTPQAEIWKHDQCKRVEDAVSRIQHTYVSEARVPQLPPEPPDPDPPGQHRHPDGAPVTTTRHKEPMPLDTPQGWEQDKATRARRATDRIQQEYVDELRQDAHYMEQLRRRSTIHEALDEEKRQRERQRVRQELFRQVPRTDDPPIRVKVQPESCDVHSRTPPGPSDIPSLPPLGICDVPSLAPPGHCDTHANVHAQVPLTEAELDEKRRQLLVQKAKSNKEQKEGKSKKKGKKGKQGSKTKSTENDAPDAGSQNIPQPQEHDTSNKNVPHPPRRDAGDEFAPHPPKQDTGSELVPHPPRNDAGSQRIPHQPVAPAKDKEQDSNNYSTRKRRLVAKGQSSDGGGYAPSIAGMHGHGPSHRYYGPGSRDARAPGADVGNSASQPRLIPRQTSQQTMCWNSETAKRGLGFKSKQTREAEQEARSKNAEAGTLSAEARNKWKKATFC